MYSSGFSFSCWQTPKENVDKTNGAANASPNLKPWRAFFHVLGTDLLQVVSLHLEATEQCDVCDGHSWQVPAQAVTVKGEEAHFGMEVDHSSVIARCTTTGKCFLGYGMCVGTRLEEDYMPWRSSEFTFEDVAHLTCVWSTNGMLIFRTDLTHTS